MTREEAIKELNDHYDTTDEVWLDFPRLKEALEMAISALSAIEKIRAEIKNEIYFWKHPRNPQIDEIRKGHEVNAVCYEHCLEIIDRYIGGKDK